jgi:hypothetical protein
VGVTDHADLARITAGVSWQHLPGIPQAASEYFGAAPSLTRNFNTVKQKESVVLDVNGTIIEILKDGNLNIKSNTHLTISSNKITISGNAISIFANNTLNISNTINITKTSSGNTILLHEDRVSVFSHPNFNDNYVDIGNNTINITKKSTGNTILIQEDLIKIKNTKNQNDTINIDEDTITINKQKVTMTGEIVTMTGSNTLSIADPGASLTPTYINDKFEEIAAEFQEVYAGIEEAKLLPPPYVPPTP